MTVEDIERRQRLCRAIPVYPEERSLKNIGKVDGRKGLALMQAISRLSSDTLICEDEGRYSWISAEAKQEALKRLSEEKRRLGRKECEG